jgi:multiple sugar transport system substrate-binding protein
MPQKKKRPSAEKKIKSISRRDFMKGVAGGVIAAGLGTNIIVSPARAERKKLKILQWSHFVPAFDVWLKETYVKEWGQKNDTEVIIDHVSIMELLDRPAAEVANQKGHDLVMFIQPPPAFEEHVIDLRDICQECEKLYGNSIPFAHRSTYNPRTRKYYGFSDSYAPDPINYRKDLWDGVGVFPDTWEDVRIGGAKIRKKYGIPVGIGLSAEDDSGMAVRAILYSFGASIQDENGNVVINSKQTLDAVKFVRALFTEAMTPEVLRWEPSSNNRFMLDGRGSLALNAISITRAAEKEDPEMSRKIWLAKSPAGPAGRIGLEHVMSVYVIWKFAENIEGAKKFLVDYIGNFRKVFVASEFYNFPSFPDTVPDLKKLIASDTKADPPDKYKVLADVHEWATNVGYPGYANAAIDEIRGTHVITTMFQRAATGEATPEEAIKEADVQCKHIFSTWRERGLV